MHFQSPHFWWLMTPRLRLTNKTLKHIKILRYSYNSPLICALSWISKIWPQMPIAQIWEKAHENSPYILESVECNSVSNKIKTMMRMTRYAQSKEHVHWLGSTGQIGEGGPTPNLGLSQCVQRNAMDLYECLLGVLRRWYTKGNSNLCME
jgi:hypothetical protein